MAQIEDLADLTPSQLARAYNLAQTALGRGDGSMVVGFRGSQGNEAVGRVERVREELRMMHGHAELLLEEGALRWQTGRSALAPSGRSSTTTLSLSGSLHLIVSVNPKRAGTRSWRTFQIYLEMDLPAPAESFIVRMMSSGFSRRLALSTLHWDVRHGYVRIAPPGGSS